MTDEIEARVQAETAKRLRNHALRQAARRLSALRAEMWNISQTPDLPVEFAQRVRRLRDNEVEHLVWDIEKAMVKG